jgi:hypothetical protein
LLRGYIAGRDPRKFKSVVESNSPGNRFYELRKVILAKANIDIDITWKNHVQLRCFELDDQLRYPDDHNPTDGRAAWCFCKENWPTLKQALHEKYEQALDAAAMCARHLTRREAS